MGAAAVAEAVAGVPPLAGAVCPAQHKTERKNRVTTTDFGIIPAPFWGMMRQPEKCKE
jgi:hypothetical protein